MALKGTLIACVASLALCFAESAVAAGMQQCVDHKTDCRDLIGKTFWITAPRSLPNIVVEFSLIRNVWDDTEKLRSGRFKIIGTAPDTSGGYILQIKRDNGKIGWISPQFAFLFSPTDPVADAKAAQADCDRRGPPKIGMTPAELVETCWRRPARIVKKTTAMGVEESYLYGLGHVVKLVDGKVSEIVEAR